MDNRWNDEPSNVLLASVARSKRDQVSTACQECRRRKSKCDALRPCGECARRDRKCVYVARENETQGQALKRKYDELARSHDSLQQLYGKLAREDEQSAIEILRRIRSGEQVDSILGLSPPDSVQQPVATSPEQRLRQDFLVNLVQSTAPLCDIVDLATSVLNSGTTINLPPPTAYEPLRDRIVGLENVCDVLREANPKQPFVKPATHASTSWDVPDKLRDRPLFWVPASPWTDVTASKHAVSHLVSLFLTLVNPYWRFVEEDLFLQAMRGRNVESSYCSPLLVNAILACASQYSEINEAFASHGQLLTRGSHFHDEATRFWKSKRRKGSITDIQALLVLTLESCLRGEDRLGWTFLTSAATHNRSLPSDDPSASTELAAMNYARAKKCIASSVVYLHLSYTMGLFRPSDTLAVTLDDAPELESSLADTTVLWVGYPLSGRPLPFRVNRLMRERSKLIRFVWELIRLFFSNDVAQHDRELRDASRDLTERLQNWYAVLPEGLRYVEVMPTGLFEFHAQYYCICMTLHDRTFQAMQEATASDAEDGIPYDELQATRAELRSITLEYAYMAATCLRDYRAHYGYKVAAPLVFHTATLAISILLRDKQQNPHTAQQVPESEIGSDPISNSETAFEECFRCLLGCGIQQMLPRGIARAIHHTAAELQVPLPEAVQQMLHMLAETAWEPSDLYYPDSLYPNHVKASGRNVRATGCRMEDTLSKWEESGGPASSGER